MLIEGRGAIHRVPREEGLRESRLIINAQHVGDHGDGLVFLGVFFVDFEVAVHGVYQAGPRRKEHSHDGGPDEEILKSRNDAEALLLAPFLRGEAFEGDVPKQHDEQGAHGGD